MDLVELEATAFGTVPSARPACGRAEDQARRPTAPARGPTLPGRQFVRPTGDRSGANSALEVQRFAMQTVSVRWAFHPCRRTGDDGTIPHYCTSDRPAAGTGNSICRGEFGTDGADASGGFAGLGSDAACHQGAGTFPGNYRSEIRRTPPARRRKPLRRQFPFRWRR